MEFNDVIQNRRSIRKFNAETISGNVVQQLLEAARLAPSGMNLQPCRYVAVKDKGMIENISKATPSAFISAAPLLIVCCVDKMVYDTAGTRVQELHHAGAFSGTSFADYSAESFFGGKKASMPWLKASLIQNAAISVEHIVLKATDLGLGSCWISIFDQEAVKGLVQIDDRYDIPFLIAIGYTDYWPDARPRLLLEDLLLKWI